MYVCVRPCCVYNPIFDAKIAELNRDHAAAAVAQQLEESHWGGFLISVPSATEATRVWVMGQVD